MRCSFSALFTALIAGTAVQAALPKANEYKTTDCSGALNFGHHSLGLHDVTMDDTSHSVYLAGATWAGFSGKSGNGGSCNGKELNALPGGCVDLDTAFPGQRIRCVRRV